MCPVCDGLTLEQSQSGPALEMKEEIKKMIVDGKSNDEIKDFFVKNMGKISYLILLKRVSTTCCGWPRYSLVCWEYFSSINIFFLKLYVVN